MNIKKLETTLVLALVATWAISSIPVILMPVHATPSPYTINAATFTYLPMMNWCGNGDYGKLNTIVTANKLMYDGTPNYDWYFYDVTLETVPGKVACNSDWRTAHIYNKFQLTNPGSGRWTVDRDPTSTQGQSSYQVSLDASAGPEGPSAGFSYAYSYSIADVVVTDQGDLSAGRAKWMHDIDEQHDVPTSVGTYLAHPGFVVKTTQNTWSLVQSTSDGSSPCGECSFRVDWGKPGWCGWLCASWTYTWMTGTFYFDAQRSRDSPNAPILDPISNKVATEGQQLSFTATGFDADSDPLFFSLGSAPSGAAITSGGLFTWTPTEAQSPGTYSVQVNVSDLQGGTASRTFTVTVNEDNSAQFISQVTPPSIMAPGQTSTISVTMKNTGVTTWVSTGTNPWRLGSQNPQDNSNWGINRAQLTQSVPPNSQYTFTFTITAPATAGTYNFQWRMVQEGVEWFGDYSPNFAVQVGTLIRIEAYRTTDIYSRSHGLAIDQPLPNPWWPPYQSGYEFKVTSNGFCTGTNPPCVDPPYTRLVGLAPGSHYVQYAASGSLPSYAWHAKIYINGVLKAEADVARDHPLQANFTV